VRNERGRLRIGGLRVRLAPEVTAEQRERMGRCLDLFQDFCLVTESVRDGIAVDVEVETMPVPAGAAA
jgi:organic hydroperoxide reductase OsmC/OhrA